jgi:type IV pilus assembly protein PilA
VSYPQSPGSVQKPKSSFPVFIIVLIAAIPAVIGLVGVLAALAIYGVRSYLVAAKSAEAKSVVMMMARDSAAAYEREVALPDGTMGHRLCPSASRSVPASAADIRGQKYMSAPSEWTVDEASDGGFACLGFSMAQPQYFMYSYESTGVGNAGDEFTARANGDLNGDGVTSTFEISGRVQPGGALEVAPNLTEILPKE